MQSEPHIARHPFDDLTGDIILRTNDKVDFYAHRLILSLSSSFFRQMFQLPQGDRITPSQNPATHPIVTLDDTSQALYQLLVWCDPRCVPTFNSLDDVELGLELAAKYDMETVIARIDSTISDTPSWIKKNPIHAFAVGVRYHMKNLTHRAARQTLFAPLDATAISTTPALRELQGGILYDLCSYHAACGQVVRGVFCEIGNDSWVPLQMSYLGDVEEFSWRDLVFFQQDRARGSDNTTRHTCHSSVFGGYPENNGICVTDWFKQYLAATELKLTAAPLSAIMEDWNHTNAFLVKARDCQLCRANCDAHLEMFNSALRDDIDELLAKITFESRP